MASSKKVYKVTISKEELRYKPRMLLKATKVITDKTKYNRKQKHKSGAA